MSEFDKPRGRREILRADGVKAIISLITERHTQEPFPAMSDHYRVPGEIGSVLLPQQLELDLDGNDAA